MSKMFSFWGATVMVALLSLGTASANERQDCVNACNQAATATSKQCQADYGTKMNDCAKLNANDERNACKKQASATLRACEAKARDNVRPCKADCMKKK